VIDIGGGYAIAAGLEQVIDYIQNLHFSPEDIAFLRSRGIFSEGFLNYLADFKFTGDIWAVPEGTPVFPKEPILTVRAPAIQAQLLETFLLLSINHQSLIATKASRIVQAAAGRAVLEFGSRRAQGSDGAILGARAAYIGGCAGTACTISDQLYGVRAGAPWPTPGPDVRQPVRGIQDLLRDLSRQRPAAGGHLQHPQERIPDAIRAFNEVLRPVASPDAASGWTAATWPISPRGPEDAG
jgi:nicotinate phosphoribosyltransferase